MELVRLTEDERKILGEVAKILRENEVNGAASHDRFYLSNLLDGIAGRVTIAHVNPVWLEEYFCG